MKVELKSYLIENNLLLVDKTAFQNFMISVSQKTKVDKRIFYIDLKTAMNKYNLTKYWFIACAKDMGSVLIVIPGKGLTSTKKYSEQSIIDELIRQGQ